jgi:DNA-binding transcriptional ArsR family regulator
MEIDPTLVTRTLATLGHPSRLLLLRALLPAPRSSQQLQEVLGVSSPGQLYHHLKDLLAAGLVRQTARSQYEIASHHVIPLLVIFAAATGFTAGAPDLGAPSEATTPER